MAEQRLMNDIKHGSRYSTFPYVAINVLNPKQLAQTHILTEIRNSAQDDR